MGAQGDFFEQNDAKICKKLAKILRWMTLVFPVLFLATATGSFQIQYRDLVILSAFGCVCTLGPGILQKLGAPVRIMKYVGVVSVGLVVMLLGGNSAVGIYIWGCRPRRNAKESRINEGGLWGWVRKQNK